MVAAELFSGKRSLRMRGERRALWFSIALAPLTIALISLLFQEITLSGFVLLIIGGLVFVSVARGRLLGSSVRIDARQFPELFALVERTAARLGVLMPQIFVRDDPFVPIAAVGIGEPYALILSSQYLEHLRESELAFLIARELAHIAAGHTRLASLLSASGRENPAVALVFGAWLRRTEYTADRVGLLCCEDFAQAIGAISITTFHAIGRRVDMAVLAEQRRELQAEPTLRMGEWISGMPFATNRLDALSAFDRSELAAYWRSALAASRTAESDEEDVEALDGPKRVTRRDCAPLVRRLAAAAIDIAVVTAIAHTSPGIRVTRTVVAGNDLPSWLKPIANHLGGGTLELDPGGILALLGFFAYSAVFVALSGQTLGMVVMELRVVTTRFARPGFLRALWRYLVAFVTTFSAIAVIGLFVRVHPHDWASGTRLVRGRKTA